MSGEKDFDAFAEIVKYRLQTTRTGAIKPSSYNVKQILSTHELFKGLIRFNTFSMRVVKQPGFMFGEGVWEDNDLTATIVWLSEHYSMDASDRMVQNIVNLIASENSYSSVKDYLMGLRWDNQPRINTWLERYFGAEESYATRIFERTFLLGAVARVIDPGCKNDNVLILEGLTGIKKSTGLRELCGADWFSDAPLDLGNSADCYLGMRGNWFIEMAELKRFKTSEAGSLRAFFSQRTDEYRVPYGRNTQNVPRQCVFVGTTNDDLYLTSSTGNRRYMPVEVKKVDVDAIAEDRDQIWAEAVQEYLALKANKQPWWFEHDDEDIVKAQNERVESDPWQDRLEIFLSNKDKVHSDDIYNELEIEISRVRKYEQSRIKSIMEILGWKIGRPYIAGCQKRGFIRKVGNEFR